MGAPPRSPQTLGAPAAPSIPADWNPFTTWQKNANQVKGKTVSTLGGTTGNIGDGSPTGSPVQQQKAGILASTPRATSVQRTGPEADFSLQQPGVAENAWSNYGDWFFGPTGMSSFVPQAQDQLSGPSASEQYWNAISGGLQGPTASQGYFSQFQQNRPDISLDAGLDPYYDRARTRTQEAIDNAFAARGGFGSSAATNTISDAMVGLGAEQANREADYYLRALDTARAYDALGGTLAQGADLTKQGLLGLGTGAAGAATSGKLGRVGALGNIISGADAGELAKRTTGHNVAQGAQGARENRIGSAFNAVSGRDAMAASAAQDAFMNLIAGDERLLDAYLSMVMGIPTEALNQNRYAGQKVTGDVGAGIAGVASIAAL